MSNCLDPGRGVSRDARSIEHARAAGESMLLPEYEVVGDGVVEHESAPMTILGNV